MKGRIIMRRKLIIFLCSVLALTSINFIRGVEVQAASTLTKGIYLVEEYAKNFDNYVISVNRMTNKTTAQKKELIIIQANLLFEQQKKANKTLNSSMSSTSYYFGGRTGAEINLAVTRFREVGSVQEANNQAFNITQGYYGKNGHNDESDAFRHAYFNYILSKKIGSASTKLWADAHEEVPVGNGAGQQPQIEKDMDLHNNQWGRNVFDWGWQMKDGTGDVGLIVRQQRCGYLRKIVGGVLTYSGSAGYCG